MIAPRSRTEPALPTTSRGPSAPTTTVGAIMLVRRRPGAAGPPATRSYSPSMLFRWMPVPGTITPDPEPVDDESDAALPSASTTDTCVVPAGAGSAIPARSGLHPLERRRRSPRSRAAARASPPACRPLVNPPSRARVCSRITSASEAIDSARPRRAVADPLEQREPVGDQDPARRRRRVRDHLVAEVGDANGPAPDDAVAREVALADRRRLPRRRSRTISRAPGRHGRARRPRPRRSARTCRRGRAGAACRRARAVSRRGGCRRACPRRCGAGSGRGSRAGAPAGASDSTPARASSIAGSSRIRQGRRP